MTFNNANRRRRKRYLNINSGKVQNKKLTTTTQQIANKIDTSHTTIDTVAETAIAYATSAS
jgi:hypothetical protein